MEVEFARWTMTLGLGLGLGSASARLGSGSASRSAAYSHLQLPRGAYSIANMSCLASPRLGADRRLASRRVLCLFTTFLSTRARKHSTLTNSSQAQHYERLLHLLQCTLWSWLATEHVRDRRPRAYAYITYDIQVISVTSLHQHVCLLYDSLHA